MIGTEIVFLLIFFVVPSRPDCIQANGSAIARCKGHSFDSFISIGENCREVRVENRPEAAFFVDKSKNRYLHMIKTLDFSWTEALIVISEYGFKDFVSLSSLNLQRSSIASLKGSWFLVNNSITSFDCSKNKLTTLLKSDLENLKMLTAADFSHNRLESIEPHTFSGMKELQELILEGNKLKSIPTGRLPMLRKFILNHNLIDIVPANAFTEIPKLQLIYLDSNALRKIEDGAFKDLKDLSDLSLTNNFIREILEFTFSGLSESTLTSLDFSSNTIHRIAPGAFKEMPFHRYLNFINLSNNSISELNEDIFEGLDARILMLSFNKIEIIGNNTFRGFKSLKSLVLNNNKLSSLTADIFGTSLPNLLEFSVSSNRISELNSDLFKFTLNVDIFSISYNKLEILPVDIFAHLRGLKFLYMQDNLIEELTESHIESLKSLKYLSIDHNKLTFIPLNQDSFQNLEEMRIGGNPWQCACLDEVQNFLSTKNITFIKNYYFDGRCPVCIPTYFQHCEKSTHFARWARIYEKYNTPSAGQCRIKYMLVHSRIFRH